MPRVRVPAMQYPLTSEVEFDARDQHGAVVAERVPVSARPVACRQCAGEGGVSFDDPTTGPQWDVCPTCDGEGVEYLVGRWFPNLHGGYDCYHTELDICREIG